VYLKRKYHSQYYARQILMRRFNHVSFSIVLCYAQLGRTTCACVYVRMLGTVKAYILNSRLGSLLIRKEVVKVRTNEAEAKNMLALLIANA
jgi:hypothetical protein